MSENPLLFRGITRFVTDVQGTVPLYQALGFEPVADHGGLVVLQSKAGVTLMLHGRMGGEPAGDLDTQLTFHAADDEVAEARGWLEDHGWTLLREPQEQDRALFWIYGDGDRNPVTLVGDR